MSKQNPAFKKERGSSLTQEQYEIIVAFLKNGIKPTRKTLKNSGFIGTRKCRNGGPDKGETKAPLNRFRSIIKRLAYRESDGEIVYKANSKIVVPNNRFEEIILTAHKSPGTKRAKHLNITRTIIKLSERYSIGCRQFGVSDEQVRIVVRRCEDCTAVKNINRMALGVGVLKNFVTQISTKPTSCSHRTETASTSMNQSVASSTASMPNTPPTIPVTLVRLPNGSFGIQPSLSQNVQSLGSSNQMPLFTIQNQTDQSEQRAVTSTPYTWQGSCVENDSFNMPAVPYMPYTSIESRISNQGPIPVQLVKVGSQPLKAGQQLLLVKGLTGFTNAQSNEQFSAEEPVDLTKDTNKPPGRGSSDSVGSAQFTLDDMKYSGLNAFGGNTSHSMQFIELDQNNNEISPFITDQNEHGSGEGVWGAVGNVKRSLGHLDKTGKQNCNYGNSEEMIDLTETGLEDQEMNEGAVRQTNAYKRITMYIKDMKLDLMKSLAGSPKATERLKKKMNHVQELLSVQKNVTKYFADLHSFP